MTASAEDAADALNEFCTVYKARTGEFACPLAKAAATRATVAPHDFWEQYGADCPKLQPIAIKVLAQFPFASACERNWSDYDFVHSKRRNKLGVKRAEQLVYAFANGRVLEQQRAVREKEYEWVGADDEFDVEPAAKPVDVESDDADDTQTAAMWDSDGESDAEFVDYRDIDSECDDMFVD